MKTAAQTLFNRIKKLNLEAYLEDKAFMMDSLAAVAMSEPDLLFLAKKDSRGFLRYSYLKHYDFDLSDDVLECFFEDVEAQSALNQMLDEAQYALKENYSHAEYMSLVMAMREVEEQCSFEDLIETDLQHENTRLKPKF